MRQLAKSLCVKWPSVNACAGQILCVPTSEKISSFEIAEVLRKSHREIETLINCMNDKTDTLGYEFNEAFEESKEDKKRLARIAYAFINDGEIERAKKELEKVFMA